MKWQVRMLVALILLGLAGLCASGLLSTFKPQFQARWGMRRTCLLTRSLCLVGVTPLLFPKRPGS